MSASRFTQHLDKCLGMGRMSSRIANQRVLSNTAINTSQENIGLNMDTISKAIDAVVAGPSSSGDFTYTTNSGGNSGFQTRTQSTESASESTVVVAKTSPSASKPALSKRRVRKRSSSPSEQTVVPPKASSSPSKRRVRNPASSPSKRTKASAVAPPLGLYEDISGDSSEDEFEDVSEMGWLDQESHSKAK